MKFNMQKGRWVIHDGMPYDPIQGQDYGGVKSQASQHCCNDDQQSEWENGNFDLEMADFKWCLTRQYACNQKAKKGISKF